MLKYGNIKKTSIMPSQKTDLIQKFVDSFHATQDSLSNGDSELAAKGYKDMLGIYNQINASNLEPLHKELAYDQLVKTYHALQKPTTSVHATTHIIAAAVLLVLFSFLVFFKPTVIGLTALEPGTSQDLNWAFIESGTRNVHLEAIPNSLKLSGKIDGNGFVRAYAVTDNSRVLLFDNDLVRINPDGTFTAACINTCNSGLDSADFKLDVLVENAALTIYSIDYD